MKRLGQLVSEIHSPSPPRPTDEATIALPWFKLDAQHMLSDLGIRECRLPTRGLLFGVLCLMHTGQPYGHLARANRPLTDDQTAIALGCSRKEVRDNLSILLNNDVLRQREDGMIFSPYLLEVKAKTDKARSDGKRGGNPTLKGPVNPDVNPSNKRRL